MYRMNTKWVGLELDRDNVRKRFRRALMCANAEFNRHGRRTASILTPYWRSDFIDLLIYEGTIYPCGVRVKSITPDFVTFEANCAGVQNEGICLDATFIIPTSEFTRSQLKQMVHDFEWYPYDRRTYGPFENIKYITSLEWWYDESYDERDKSDE